MTQAFALCMRSFIDGAAPRLWRCCVIRRERADGTPTLDPIIAVLFGLENATDF